MLKAYKSIFGPFKEIMANAGIPGEPAQFERALNSIHYPSMLAQPEERHNEPDVFGAISITAPGEPTSTPFPQTPNPQIIYSLSFLLPPGWGEMGIPINLLYLPADEIPNQPDKVQFRRTEVFSV